MNRPTNPTPETLTPRETTVLAALARFRFLTAGHLEAFLFTAADSQISPASRPVLTHRTLTVLRRAGLITRTQRAAGGPGGGSGSFAYFLTAKGARAINDTTPTATVRRSAPRGTFLMRHALAAADVDVAFTTEAARRRGHDLLVWESDWEIIQRIGNETLIPDAYLIYASQQTELHAFVEIDLGTAGSRFFQSKVERYLRLYRSGRWQQSFELWPTVLTITPSQTRSDLLRRSTETVLRAEPQRDRLGAETEFAFTELDRVISDGPLAAIWTLAGSTGTHRLLNGSRKEKPHAPER